MSVIDINEPCAVISNSNWKNYWHWHAQCLTNIQAIKDAGLFGKVKLLTPTLNAWRLKSLYALGVDESMLIKVKANLLRISHLYRPSFVNKISQPNIHPCSVDTYKAIRTYYAKNFSSNNRNRKIYVARYDAVNARKLVNEEQLAETLRQQGFEIIIPGNLTYESQVEICANAKVVIGAHGAGLTNIIFCQAKTLFIELFPDYYFFDKKTAYRNHAHIGELNYACYVSDGYLHENQRCEASELLEQGKQSNFSWKINIEDFFQFLKETIKKHGEIDAQ